MFRFKFLVRIFSIITLAAGLLPLGATPAQAAPAGRGLISGIVWKDYCAFDCVAGSSLKANNGFVNVAEPRLQGAKVTLSPGKCGDSRGKRTAITNRNGYYEFRNLAPGKYCVRVTARQSRALFPKPGHWSRPSASGLIARYDVTVVGSGVYANRSFGWVKAGY